MLEEWNIGRMGYGPPARRAYALERNWESGVPFGNLKIVLLVKFVLTENYKMFRKNNLL